MSDFLDYDVNSSGVAMTRVFRVGAPNQISGVPSSGVSYSYGNDTFLGVNTQTGVNTQGFISDGLPCAGLIGLPDLPQERPISVDGRTSAPAKIPYNGAQDYLRYGNILASFRLGDDLEASGLTSLEKMISHQRYVGKLRDGWNQNYDYYRALPTPRDVSCLSGSFPIGFQQSSFPANVPVRLQPLTFGGDGFLTFSVLSGVVTGGRHIGYDFALFFEEAFKAFATLGTMSRVGSSSWTFSYTYLSHSVVSTTNWRLLQGSYLYKMRVSPPLVPWQVSETVFHVRINLLVDFVPLYGSNAVFGGARALTPGCVRLLDSSETTLVSHTSTYGATVGPITPWRWNWVSSAPVSVFSGIQQYSVPPDATRFHAYKRHGTGDIGFVHHRQVATLRNLLPSVRPASFYSASAALNSDIDALKANHLETLSELDSLLKVLPDLRGAGRAMAKIAKRDPSGLKDLVDFATSEYLRFRFGTSPTAANIAEASTADLLKSVRRLGQMRTAVAYGRFNYTFLDSENPFSDGVCTLEVVSKIKFSLDLSSVIGTLLATKSLGLLPSFSSLWELVPFSFVADWFTGLGSRLKQVDNQVLWLAVHFHWALHSYKLVYKPSAANLLSYGLSTDSTGKPFKVEAYYRELTRFPPILRDSKFDFLAPSGKVDPATVGSLIWQVLT